MDDKFDGTQGYDREDSHETKTHPEHTSGFDSIKTIVAGKLRGAAGTLQEKVDHSTSGGELNRYGREASDLLNRSADYINDIDLDQCKADVERQVRQNPARSLLIAGGVGLLLGVWLRRR